ncbi:hypothetical protein HA402_013757 [Bradysia odoriphaga]|nr:hypothetical protein HA402_013757 [Bradysia odoriphaga]
MDCPIQKFTSNKSVITNSKCICEIENFGKYKFNERINLAQVSFFEFDSEWKAEIIPDYYNDTYFKLKVNLNPAIVCQLENLQCQVSGTSGSVNLFESGYLNVGKGEFLHSSSVEKQSLLNLLSKDGTLIVVLQVELKYKLDPMSFQKRHCSTNTKLQLADQYSSLLDDATHSDFTFIVKDKSFKVHKNILASVSETMRAMFASQYKETSEGACRVDDIEPNIFHSMIQFIYAGVIPANLEDISVDLYKVADYYRIAKLMEICKEAIHFRLISSNALGVYELATLYNIEDVRLDAWKIVKSQCFKIAFPLNNEPLSLEDFQEIRDLQMREMKIWTKHKKPNSANPAQELSLRKK